MNKKPAPRKFQSKAVQFLYDRYIGDDPERIQEYEEGELNDEIARKIYALRTTAKLTQKQLARRVGTTAEIINRLEEADFDGPYLIMLKRIAEAVNSRMEISLVDSKNRKLKIA